MNCENNDERKVMKVMIRPPEGILNILDTFKKNGFEAYAVGGCIRDSILGREPADWDIATNALPSEVKGLFSRTIDTGLKHGTVTVVQGGQAIEVTTFRIEGKYEDGRHPDKVEFTASIEADLSRRDFTMNAMAWNEVSGIVDPFGGMKDIAAGVIKAVGNPGNRFREDALRILRAVRFTARLGFEIYNETFKAICENKDFILNISSERIRDELTGILTSDFPMKFGLLRETGLLQLILPELEACYNTQQNNPHHVFNVGEHSLIAAAAVKNDRCLRWAMLLHDTGKAVTRTTDGKGIDHFYGHALHSVEIAGNILKRLRFDNRSMEKITRLIKHHDRQIEPRSKSVAKAVNAVGEDIFTSLLDVKRADKAAQNPADIRKGLEYVDTLENIFYDLKKEGNFFALKDLAISGKELIEIGFKEGKEIGQTLDILLDKVMNEPSLNKKEILYRMAADLFKKMKSS